MARFAICALLVLALGGCDVLRSRVTGHVDVVTDKTDYALGEEIAINYVVPIPLDAGASSYWVTLVPPGAPEADYGDWHYVVGGVVLDKMKTSARGKFEIRLHDGYPTLPFHVIARRTVVIH
jgi:hypothetical protein